MYYHNRMHAVMSWSIKIETKRTSLNEVEYVFKDHYDDSFFFAGRKEGHVSNEIPMMDISLASLEVWWVNLIHLVCTRIYSVSQHKPCLLFQIYSRVPTMASSIESYVNRMVSIITADGRNFGGTLKGFDQTINVILDDTHERVYSSTTGVEQVVLGLHIVRGDNIAIIGELDEEVDQRLDLSNIKAEPVMSIVR